MSQSAEQVLTAALDLPESERWEVVEALIVSLQPTDRPPFDDSWREVILRRSAELASGQVTGIPWAEVKRRAREAAGG
jgi:putative addiction module component (TIGR02574 family)